MRRIYYMNPKRKQIVREAMTQMRATRAALGPEFVTRIRMLIKDFDPEYLQQLGVSLDDEPIPKSWTPGEAVNLPPRSDTFDQGGVEPVDQKKNLLIIMKFLQLNPHNKSVQTQVRTLLAETKTIQ